MHSLRELQGIDLRQVADLDLILAQKCLESHIDHTDIILTPEQRRDRTVKVQHTIYGYHSCTNACFHGEHYIALQLNKLTDESKIFIARRNYLWAVFKLTGHKLAGDIGHNHGDSLDVRHDLFYLILQTAVRQEFPHNFFAAALRHRLINICAAVICVQTVEPHKLNILRLIWSDGLKRNIVIYEPRCVHKGGAAALSCEVTRLFGEVIKELRIVTNRN